MQKLKALLMSPRQTFFKLFSLTIQHKLKDESKSSRDILEFAEYDIIKINKKISSYFSSSYSIRL
jgi:hypothetical protein